MKLRLKLIFTALLLTGAVFMFKSTSFSSDFTYAIYSSRDPALNISLDYISGWACSEQKGANDSFSQVVFYPVRKAGETSTEAIVVTAEKSQKPVLDSAALEARVKDLIDKRMKFKDAKVLSKSKTDFQGQAAWNIELTYKMMNNLYSMSAGLVTSKERAVILAKGGKFYILRYQNSESEFDKFAKAFSHILDSLKFK